MSRSFNTLPNVRFEKVTLARSGRRTYKVRGKFEEMRTIPQYREPRPMVIPEQDHVQICKFRRTPHIQKFRLNPQECYSNTRLFFGRGRASCIPFDPQEAFFDRERYENEQSRFIMEQNARDEIEEIDYYGFDEFDEWDFLNYSISGDDRDPLDFHSI
jgi:hypothetical protein